MRIAMVAAIFLAAAPAAAQMGNPAGVTPGTQEKAPGVPAPHTTNVEDRLFARLLAAGGEAEVELGRMAEGKARSQAVKDFARQMIADHGKANGELTRLAEAAQIAFPGELAPEEKTMRDALEDTSADAFDLAYMQGQVVSHQKAVVLLEWEIGQGQDAPLQQWAAGTLPVVLAHLDMAKKLVTELTGQAPRVSAQTSSEAPKPPPRKSR